MDDAEIQDIARLLWEAPFGVLSIDLETDPEIPKYVVIPSLLILIYCLHVCSSMRRCYTLALPPGLQPRPHRFL